LIGTIGGRWFHTDNSLKGYYGFSEGFAPTSSYGVAGCISPNPFHGAPCMDFDKSTKETDSLGKANLTWQITPDKMIYGTWSEGFRPGGINRRGSLPPYKSDFLTNYEFGWKTTWLDHRLSYNGAIFRENWKDFQFSILGANGLTEIRNAGQARINGIEQDLNWAATYNLQIGAGMAYYDAKLTQDYCGFTDTNGNPITYCPAGSVNPITGAVVTGPLAPKGTRLPVTPKLKYNINARYTTNIGKYEVFGQAAVVHVGGRTTDLRVFANDLLGNMPAYTTVDFTVGGKYHGMSLDLYVNNAFDKRGQLFRYAECAAATCAAHDVVPQYPNGQVYTVMNQPRTVGIRFSQEF
jgi:outer membrane receptor protein involved in Fe transport